jgi:hypothetical protein
MATRILILADDGTALCALDGHHGVAHAGQWAGEMLTRLRAEGIEATVLEIHPEEGGDAMRRGVFGNLHRLRAEFHERPDGARELVGLNVFAEANQAEQRAAKVGAGAGLRLAQAAAPAVAVRGALRLLAAPATVTGTRHPLRLTRGRMEPDPYEPTTIAEARLQRRHDRAQSRRSP